MKYIGLLALIAGLAFDAALLAVIMVALLVPW
jgi:hypothetical protein